MIKKTMMCVVLCFTVAGMLNAEGRAEVTSTGRPIQTFRIYLAREKDNYPREGTYLGSWLQEKTAVRMQWEFPVGDPRQKIGLLIAGGDYPDLIDGRNDNQALYDAKAFIPLDELIEKYGTNVKKLYGDKLDMLRRADGRIYWLPQLFPYGNRVRRTAETLGFYIQKRVLKDNGWIMPKSVEEAVDMLIAYARKHPTTNGRKTLVWTAMSTTWRNFALLNAPHVFSGHPNDGVADVDWVNGRWVVRRYDNTPEAYKIYKIYNKIHLAGLYDVESLVFDYDQYLARIAQGNVLAFTDQRWQFDVSNRLLKQQDQDLWYVPMPIVMQGYKLEWEGPLDAQVSEGVGITVDCKDPVAAFQWLDAQASEEFQILKQWGVKGEHYLVDRDGYFYRTPEMQKQWDDQRWRDRVYGQTYFIEMVGWHHGSLLSDGKNSVNPQNQPSVFFESLLDTEKEVLNAYGKKVWTDFMNQPDIRRIGYFPLWTIKLPTGSDIDVANRRILQTREKWTPQLIMAPTGRYDEVWARYLAELRLISDQDKLYKFYQDEMDKRLRTAGFLK